MQEWCALAGMRADCVFGDRKRTAFDWALVVREHMKAKKPK